MPNRSTKRPARKPPAEVNSQEAPRAKDQPNANGADSYRQLLDNLLVGVALASPAGALFYANPRFCEILVRSPFEEPAGRNLKSFFAASCWEELQGALSRGADEATQGETTIVTSDMGQKIVRLSFSPFTIEPPSVQVVATDVTDLAEAKEALRHAEDSVNSLSARMLQLQDEERRRLARDLHDTTGQELAVAVMTLDSLSRNLERPNINIRKNLEDAAQLLRKVESGIRTFSYLLHPPLLDEMGLGPALTWYIEGFVKRSGIQVELSIAEDLPRLPEQAETALFRVTQESLTNVLRHSHSNRAWVTVASNGRLLQVKVRDEGRGFDYRPLTGRPALGVGIEGMRGRLKALGGTLDVRSGLNGTLVTASVPRVPELDSAAATAQNLRERAGRGDMAAAGVKRLLIVDDHEIARQGIRFLLKDERDLEVCGEAQNAAEAFAKTQQLHPDLVILDLNMPGGGGFSAAHRIRRAGLSAKILIYTTHSYGGLERMARAADCDGFVVKTEATKDLVRGIRAVLRGKTFFRTLAPGGGLVES